MSNEKIILDQILDQKKAEVSPGSSSAEYFEIFTTEQILKHYDLTYDEIEQGIVGNGGDGGIDSIYIFVNGELVRDDSDYEIYKKNIVIELKIIQAKTTAGFSEDALDKFEAVSANLLDLSKNVDDFNSVYNKNLTGVIRNFRSAHTKLAPRFPEIRVSYFYASKGEEVNHTLHRKVDRLRDTVTKLFSQAIFEFQFLGAKDLLELARKTPKSSFNLALAENPISASGAVAFICLVKLQEFYSFITDESGQLLKAIFESNVRDYQGQNPINEAIHASLLESKKEDFWWLNNGITIVASKAVQSAKALTIEDPQIVNGLQTSTEIHKYLKAGIPADEKRNVLVRVVVPEGNESRDKIIKATNSQTTIPTASLRATEKIHRDIEEFLRPYGYFYDRRKNFYKNEGKPIEKIIGIPFVAQSIMSIVLRKPNDARARPSSLLKDDDDYERVFSSSYPITLYLQCARFMKNVEAFIRSEAAALDKKDQNNLKYHLAMYSTCVLANKKEPSPDDISRLNFLTITESKFVANLRDVKTIYESLGGNDQVSKGPQLVISLLEKFT